MNGTEYTAKVRVKVNPSEDREKVEKAVRFVFPDIVLEHIDGYLTGKSDLDLIRDEIRRLRMRDAVRAHLKTNADPSENVCRFSLSKQAAFVGRLNFSTGTEPPLGDIMVEVRTDSLDGLLKHLDVEDTE